MSFVDADTDRFTGWLRERSEPAWGDAVDHQFIRELTAGTVADDVFRRYLLQDYAFLDALVGAFGHAVGLAPTMAARSRLVGFLGTLTDEENDYFERAFAALEVPPERYRDPALAPPTAAFRDLLVAAAAKGYAELLAVLVPAEWIYRSWAGGVTNRPDRFYHEEWIGLHDTPEFDAFVSWLRSELDREGPELSPRREARVADIFERTADLEVAFFDAAYQE